MAQRPPQLPAVMMSHYGVTISSSTPRRSAISLPTSTSKPSISLLSLRKDCGGYSGSDDMVSVLVLITRTRVSPACAAGTAATDASKAAAPSLAIFLMSLSLLLFVVHPAPALTASSVRSEEHTSELQSLMRISYAVLCL